MNSVEKKPILENLEKAGKLLQLVAGRGFQFFEYDAMRDSLLLYDHDLNPKKRVEGYMDLLKSSPRIHPEDRWKAIEFCRGKLRGAVTIRVIDKAGKIRRKVVESTLVYKNENETFLVGVFGDAISSSARQEYLEDQILRDVLTGLYNKRAAKEMVDEYICHRVSEESCGMLVVDIDNFKHVNDRYGHLFGDKAVVELGDLLRMTFDSRDIVARVGGDEFMVFVKGIERALLEEKSEELVRNIRRLHFPYPDYTMTCSVGVSFLPHGHYGFDYNQLFENSDRALYRAKKKGRDCYEFCEELVHVQVPELYEKPSLLLGGGVKTQNERKRSTEHPRDD
ncbi:GGDEF domain-containing protein [Brotaphodocola sp.]|uniref:GGDEF domain-containing protein n=1 Tax=Brotaphodocola sp. TaxID=3073577 RepID=UPI003D7EEAF1